MEKSPAMIFRKVWNIVMSLILITGLFSASGTAVRAETREIIQGAVYRSGDTIQNSTADTTFKYVVGEESFTISSGTSYTLSGNAPVYDTGSSAWIFTVSGGGSGGILPVPGEAGPVPDGFYISSMMTDGEDVKTIIIGLSLVYPESYAAADITVNVITADSELIGPEFTFESFDTSKTVAELKTAIADSIPGESVWKNTGCYILKTSQDAADAMADTAAVSSYLPSGSTELTLSLALDKVQLTRNLNGGKIGETEGTVIDWFPKGTSITLDYCGTPVKDGASFDGWYKEHTFDTKVTEGFTLTNNSALFAKYTETPSAPVESIDIEAVSLELIYDESNPGSANLNVTFTPNNATNKNLTWQSSDEGVATVNADGVVTAAGTGEATITATSEDGNHSDTCAVTVTASQPEPHTHDDLTFDPLPADTLPVNGNYYLTENIVLTDQWTVTGGNTLSVCLNGKTITGADGKPVFSVETGGTLNLYDHEGNAGKVTHPEGKTGRGADVNGTFNMYGGTITGNNVEGFEGIDESGGGVRNIGAFNMYGGIITANKADNGGGVLADLFSETVISGGTITGNSVILAGGDIYASTSFSVCGSVTVGEADLSRRSIINVIGPLDDTARIGFLAKNPTAEESVVIITSGLKGNGSISNFISLLEYNITETDDGEAAIVLPDPVASVSTDSGTAEYTYFSDAVTDWKKSSGSTLTLLADVVTDTTIDVPAGDYTFNLNGHGLTYTGSNGSVFSAADDSDYGDKTRKLTIADNGPDSSTVHKYFPAADGAGLAYVDDINGTVEFTGGYITGGKGTPGGDSFTRGGAVCLRSGILDFRGGMIIGNEAGFGGGIMAQNSDITMSAPAAIIGNSARGGQGGAVCIEHGSSLTMSSGTISNNESTTSGGGVYVKNDTDFKNTFTMSGGSVINNTAAQNGGGVYAGGADQFAVSGKPVIENNNSVYLDSPNNVYLATDKARIVISGALDEDVEISVRTLVSPAPGSSVEITSGLNGKGSIANFTSDDSDYTTRINSSREAALIVKGDYAAAVTASDGTTTEYTDYMEALDAWTDGSTLTLLTDIETKYIVNVTDGTRTLDMNGQILRIYDDYAVRCSGTAELTLKDSSEKQYGEIKTNRSADGTIAVRVSDTAVVNLESGNITNSARGVYISENSVFNMNGGRICVKNAAVSAHHNASFNMNDGTIIRDDVQTGGSWGLDIQNSSSVTVAGGSVSGYNYGIYLSGFKGNTPNAVVTGGDISGSRAAVMLRGLGAAMSFVMKDGTVSGAEDGAAFVQISEDQDFPGSTYNVEVLGGKIKGAFSTGDSQPDIALKGGVYDDAAKNSVENYPAFGYAWRDNTGADAHEYPHTVGISPYTVIFDKNCDGDAESIPDPVTATLYDGYYRISKPESIPTRKGYTFMEWQMFDGQPFFPDNRRSVIVPEGGLTAYAKWDAIKTVQVTLVNTGHSKAYNDVAAVLSNAHPGEHCEFTNFRQSGDDIVFDYLYPASGAEEQTAGKLLSEIALPFSRVSSEKIRDGEEQFDVIGLTGNETSYEEINAEWDDETPLGETQTYHILWSRPIDKAVISAEAPLCGTQSSGSVFSQTNRPAVTVSGDAEYEVSAFDGEQMTAWITYPSGEPYNEKMKGGTEYYYAVELEPHFGYYFSSKTQADANGKAAVRVDVERSGMLVTAVGTVTAEHVWGETSYTWSDDHKKVTAKRVCESDPEHTEKETVTASGKVTAEATCSAMGKTTYTSAEFTNKAFKKQEIEVEDVPVDPDNHKWGEWTADQAPTLIDAGKEKRVCQRNKEHVEYRETEKVVYITVSGDGTVWTKGSNTAIDFTFKRTVSDESFKYFTGIKVDGSEVSGSNYSVSEGSTIVKLNPEYLETLSVGGHTITVMFTEPGIGSAEASAGFIVKAASSGGGSSSGGEAAPGKPSRPIDSVVTCQMAGYPSNYSWNEAAKACQPGYLDAGGNFHPYKRSSVPNTGDMDLTIYAWIAMLAVTLAVYCGVKLLHEDWEV